MSIVFDACGFAGIRGFTRMLIVSSQTLLISCNTEHAQLYGTAILKSFCVRLLALLENKYEVLVTELYVHVSI